MKTYSSTLFAALEDSLHTIKISQHCKIKSAELSLLATEAAILALKKFILKYKFLHKDEEICFFKEIKPLFVSKLIYHNKLYHIESRKPEAGDKAIRKYLVEELNKIRHFYSNNHEFYTYYRTGNSCLDDKYFVRQQHDIRLNVDAIYFETDHRFTTSHDFKVARILANELLIVYLENALKKDILKETEPASTVPALNWTDSKTALIELVYALHSQAVIDHGKAEIKDIASRFESLFNIDLGDYYRTYLELRMRKTGRTKFLDTMRENLNKRMDEQEERL